MAAGFLTMFFSIRATAQRQQDTSGAFQPLIPVSKQSLLANMDVLANFRFAFRNEFEKGSYTGSRFTMEQFRLEIVGKLHEKLYFRFRDRYTRATEPQSIDNLSHSTDMAYLRFDPNKQWKIYVGKLCADWGGYEFDANPIDIYEYSDVVEYSDNFMTGAGVGYLPSPRHEFTFQLLNSRTKRFDELYDSIPGIRESKFPFAAVLNWRGSFWNGRINTIWSYSIFKEAHSQYMNYIALGNQLKLRRFMLEYDFKWSSEQLDRKMIVSGWMPDKMAVQGVSYMSHWVRADVKILPMMNFFFVGMVDFANWHRNPDKGVDKRLRTVWGYIPGVEIYPIRDFNLRVFGSMIGRIYRYTGYAQTKFKLEDTSTFRFAVGVMAPLLIL